MMAGSPQYIRKARVSESRGLLIVGAMLAIFSSSQFAAAIDNIYAPVDKAGSDQEFVAFRENLLQAVVERDIDRILSASATDVTLDFGGGQGLDLLQRKLTHKAGKDEWDQIDQINLLREEYWHALEAVLRMGGRFNDKGEFEAPYTWGLPIPKRHDPFETYYVIKDGAELLDRPSIYAKPLRRLTFEPLRSIDGGDGGTRYVHVETLDKSRGYVSDRSVWQALYYRAIFSKTSEGWKLVAFVAGE